MPITRPSVEPGSRAGERLLITGGAGFIGSRLARAWLDRGGRVVVLDDLSRGRVARLAGLADRGLEFQRGSVLDAGAVRDLVGQCDAVAHLAAVVGVGRVSAEPARTLAVNGSGSRVVLEAAAAVGARVLMTSSSEVYATELRPPFAESAGPALGEHRHPRAGYAISKAYAERVGADLARHAGLGLTTVRLFNTTGPDQGAASGMVLPRMIERALEGRPLVVHGDGLQTRCFSHVDDVAEALARLLERPGRGAVFNVGSDVEVSILDLAREVRSRAVRSGLAPPDLEYRDPASEYGPGFFDATRRAPDLSALRAELGELPGRPWRRLVGEAFAARAQARAAAAEGGVPLQAAPAERAPASARAERV